MYPPNLGTVIEAHSNLHCTPNIMTCYCETYGCIRASGRSGHQNCNQSLVVMASMAAVQPTTFQAIQSAFIVQGTVQQLTVCSSPHHAAALAPCHPKPCSMDAAVIDVPKVQHAATPGSPGQQDRPQKPAEGGQKRQAQTAVDTASTPSLDSDVTTAVDHDRQAFFTATKRRRAESPSETGQQGHDDSSNAASLAQPASANPQHDRSHLRQPHTLMDDADDEAVPGPDTDKKEQDTAGAKQQKHKRSHPKSKHKPLLSFEEEEGDAAATAAEPPAAADPGQHDVAGSITAQQQQGGGISQATTAKFKAEAKQATAARFTFKPSGSSVTTAVGLHSPARAQQQHQQQQQRLGLVDEDEGFRVAAPAGLTQIHFGMAQARGARPYQEDRHCIVTALKPSSSHTAAAGDSSNDAAHWNGSSAAVQNGQYEQQPAVVGLSHDGVARCYAAIFDGHNGAGAAETAARQLHLLLAGHPALRIYKGEPGPPAVIKQEEAAVSKALKAAFRQIDDLVLAVARRDGTRDGATALVVLRLGGVLYSAHAGDSRAVLCRDGHAHRLTEDHKPHLPQERRRIEDAGGRVDFQRCWRVVVEPRDGRPGSGLAVSRSLGDLDFKEPARFVECDPDVTRLALQPHKDRFVILGSDGLWDVLSDTDAVVTAAAALKAYALEQQRGSTHQQASMAAVTAATELYKQQPQPQQLLFGPPGPTGARSQLLKAELPDSLTYSDEAATAAAEALLAESMRRGTMDNVTVIVMLLQWE